MSVSSMSCAYKSACLAFQTVANDLSHSRIHTDETRLIKTGGETSREP